MTADDIAKLAQTESRSKSNMARIDKLEERQDNMDKIITSVAELANEQCHIKDDVTEIKGDVKSLAEKPAKRWERLTEKITWLFVGGVIMFCLAQIGIQ